MSSQNGCSFFVVFVYITQNTPIVMHVALW